ncbi:MAG TPA: inositol monophosphatase [Stellaceae bacterium]|nr:inositol monophosphatase [Stellaceae bacterium]
MIDPERVGDIIRETAAAEIVPRFRMLRQEDIREKKPGDLVTLADLESERRLTQRLAAVLPGSLVLGEEAAAEDPARLGLLTTDASLWIIDPIDGTANFARGRTGFAVIVARIEQRSVQAGWIYDPLEDLMVIAERGAGAWSRGTRLAVASETEPRRMKGAAYGRTRAGTRAATALESAGRIGRVRNRGCSALEYAEIALGRAHFSLHSRSLPWDHAAGILIVREAGGVAGFADGSAYDPSILDRPVLATSNEIAWEVVCGGVGPFA